MQRPSLLTCMLAAFASTAIVAGCGGGSGTSTPSQPFEPQASLRAVGGAVRTAKPQFVLHVVTRPGDANIRSLAVNLPPVVLVDSTSIGRLCTQREWKSNRCAGRQRLGFAHVLSPAYRGALAGPVYAVTGSGPLPHLAYLLHGPTEVLLEGRVVSKGGRIQAGVEDLPDVPLKEFVFTLYGGKHGYLVLSTNICGARAMADSKFTSQEGQIRDEKVPLTANCP